MLVLPRRRFIRCLMPSRLWPPTGVIQPMPAPPGSRSMAMRPTSGTSKIGITSLAPALTALATRASTSSTARNDIQLSGTPSNWGEVSGNMPATGLPSEHGDPIGVAVGRRRWPRRSSRWCPRRIAWRARRRGFCSSFQWNVAVRHQLTLRVALLLALLGRPRCLRALPSCRHGAISAAERATTR